MRYHERLNIIFMRDNGPRRSIRLRRSKFYLFLIFFLSLPFLCLLLGVQCWLLWQENVTLRENVERFESDYQAAEYRAERLEKLEALLQEENVSAREILIKQLAGNPPVPQVASENATETVSLETTEGPGHEDFPAVDTGRVKIDNVQIRALRSNDLRVGMDLRNPENEALLSGEVGATLVTAEGEKSLLSFAPQDAGNFRINRFKRAVMTAQVPRGMNLVNASVILEVRDQAGSTIYQNIFAVQR